MRNLVDDDVKNSKKIQNLDDFITNQPVECEASFTIGKWPLAMLLFFVILSVGQNRGFHIFSRIFFQHLKTGNDGYNMIQSHAYLAVHQERKISARL